MGNDQNKKSADTNKDAKKIHTASHSNATPIHDTAGGEMPDPKAKSNSSSAEKDAKIAFAPKQK